jgi:hypothetical protein|eukprot:SAG25_NODE_515_length_7274_cov_3.113031_3_plen_82_part_00
MIDKHILFRSYSVTAVPDCDSTWIPPEPSWDEGVATTEEDRTDGIKGQKVLAELPDENMEMFEPPAEKLMMVRPANQTNLL